MQMTSVKIFKGNHETKVMVTSTRCRYSVWFAKGVITLSGPGVEETADIDMVFDSLEEYAMYIVLLFEANMWPE